MTYYCLKKWDKNRDKLKEQFKTEKQWTDEYKKIVISLMKENIL